MKTVTVQKANLLLDRITRSRHALDTARKLYADRLAPDFNPLQFLQLNELMWSRLLGWLLNPRETHAQKGIFLDLFMRHVCHHDRNWSEAECNRAMLEIEHSFGDGRIDIWIKCDDRLLIIENKPYAADQEQQLRRYYRYAEMQVRNRCNITIVYLTAHGNRPSQSSISKDEMETRLSEGTLILQSYRYLALSSDMGMPSWLDACRLACRSPRVASFIEEIQAQMNSEFSGVSDMNETNAIIDIMSDSSDSIRSSFQVSQNMHHLKCIIFNKLVNIIDSDNSFYIILSKGIFQNGFFIDFDIDINAPYIVRVQAYDVMAIGLLWRDEKSRLESPLIYVSNKLSNELNCLSKPVKWGAIWAWVTRLSVDNEFCKLPYDFWINPEPWVQIANYDLGNHLPQDHVAAIIIAAIRKIKDTLVAAEKRGAMIENDD